MTTRTDTEARSARGPRFDPAEYEQRWRERWEADGLYRADDRDPRQKHYLLTMYPYPSGDLHIGHWYAATGPDIVARMRRMQGLNVMFPMGFDSFGLPAENAAIDRGIHPAIWTNANIERMRAQFRTTGCGFDWSRGGGGQRPALLPLDAVAVPAVLQRRAGVSVHGGGRLVPEGPGGAGASRWRGGSALLALRHAGHQARPGAVVLPHHQLRGRAAGLHGMDWPEPIRLMQTNWIGRSEGAEIAFAVEADDVEPIQVFTTRPDTVFGATFMVLAPEHPLVPALTTDEQRAEVEAYVARRDARPRSSGCRPSARRPASSSAPTPSTR